MDAHLAELLRRLGEAETASKRAGHERQPFLLIYAVGGSVGIKHPGWDDSWMRPTAEDIDDLDELGHVRNEPPKNTKRVFTLTVRGRRAAEVLMQSPEAMAAPGRAPSLDETLRWLIAIEQESPGALAAPGRLPALAVDSGLIEAGSEESFAQRIIDLLSEGFLTGDAPDFDAAGPLQRLQLSEDFRLTMRAHERQDGGRGPSTTLNFQGSVVAGQIAAGDISNYMSFGDLLDKAEVEIRALGDVSAEDQAVALTLIDVLRGQATSAGAQVLTGAGGGLLAQVLAQLIGLSPPA